MHSESSEGSTKRAYNAYIIYWFFFVLKWSVRPRVMAFANVVFSLLLFYPSLGLSLNIILLFKVVDNFFTKFGKRGRA